MAKRIVTKIGDVFCVEIDGNKRFFQYICNDLCCMNSTVIRVFRTVYPGSYEPKIDEIVRDEIDFHAHTILKIGIQLGVCYKVGKSRDVLDETFGYIPFVVMYEKDGVRKNYWELTFDDFLIRIWNLNEHIETYTNVPKSLMYKLEIGSVLPMPWIAERLRTGYYVFTAREFSVAKRRPYPYVESFTKRVVNEDLTEYYRFKGDTLIEKFNMNKNGEITEFSSLASTSKLPDIKFGDINWGKNDFISKEKYEEMKDHSFPL